MAEVVAGSKAPLFTLEDAEGKSVSLESFKGKWVALYFYPRDNTPGCTRQACAFAGAFSEMEKRNVKVVGVSKDSVKSHAGFSAKHGLNFTLLSDPEHRVMEEYGVWTEKKLYGKVSMGTVRTCFLIDPEGVVRRVWKKVKPDDNARLVLEFMDSEADA